MRAKAKKRTRIPPALDTTAPPHEEPSQRTSHIKPASPSAPYFSGTSVPQSYGETLMCAVPRDPGSIFVYWEIAPDTIDSLVKAAGDHVFHSSKWTVRVSDVTDISFDGTNAWQTLDITIDKGEHKKYIQVPEPGRTYLAQCGLLTPDNSFLEAVRSNPCAVPRKGVSDRLDAAWTMVGTAELIRISADALSGGAAEGQRLNGLGIALGEGSGSGSIG